ncbi:MAG: GNAT family N-acetyltransferase [Candidatus Bathyarchaeia archaeon]
MKHLEIRNVALESIDDLIDLCIPPDRKNEPYFVEAKRAKRKWATHLLGKHECIAKLAYLDAKPVGLIQYRLVPEERVVKIQCIFVPEKENLRKGIGKALLKALISETTENPATLALVTHAFRVPGRYPQNEFYIKMGFKKVTEDDPFLLYYPLKAGYVYQPKEEKFTPQKEDFGKALIFYDPSCPFSIYFSERIKESIREVAPNLPIRMINMFEEQEEVKIRGQVPTCAVNGQPIKAFFLDKENFHKEVKEALAKKVDA